MKKSILALFATVMIGCTQQSPVAPDSLASGAGTHAHGARIDTSAGHGGRPLHAVLTGAEEVPGPGDPDGSGTARITLNAGQQEICFELTVTDIEPATAAHIHEGPAGSAGPVVVSLAAPTSGHSKGCVAADRELIREVLQNPSHYYVNVHNAPFPPGAIRGQLSK